MLSPVLWHKINILQEEHIVVSKKTIAEVLVNWDLYDAKVEDIVFPGTGEISNTANYVGEDLIIKYTPDLVKTQKAIEISKALEDIGLSSPSVLPTRDGREYVEKDGLYFVLTKRVSGERIMASKLYLNDYEIKARFIGEIVGRLDLALAKIDVIAEDVDLEKAVSEWAVPSLKGKLDIEAGSLDEILGRFSALYKDLPRQVVHRDPNPGNIILAEDKWGFIDFELSERNARIFDPCYLAAAVLSETFEEGNEEMLLKWVNVMKEIMSGYDSVVKMTESEKEAIPYMILANQFISTAFFVGKDKHGDLYKTNKGITEWIARNLDKMCITD